MDRAGGGVAPRPPVAAHPDGVAARTAMVAVRLTGTGFATGRVPHPTLDLPGAVGARPALLVSVEILAPALNQNLPAPDRAAALRLPTLVRTPGDPPPERGSVPAAPLRQGEADHSDAIDPRNQPFVKAGQVQSAGRCEWCATGVLPCSAQRSFPRVPERSRVTCGPQGSPSSGRAGEPLACATRQASRSGHASEKDQRPQCERGRDW